MPSFDSAELSRGPVPGLILKAGLPSILPAAAPVLFQLTDSWFLRQSSTQALGAVSLVTAVTAAFQTIGLTFGHGAAILAARSTGSGNEEAAQGFRKGGLFFCILTGALFAALGLLRLSGLLSLLGCPPELLAYAAPYTFCLLLAGPLLAISHVLTALLRCDGRAGAAMACTLAGLLLHGLLDHGLIPALGTTGAGLSGILSQLVLFLLLLFCFHKAAGYRQAPSAATGKVAICGKLLLAGSPALIRQGLCSISSLVLMRLAAGQGPDFLAAIGISHQVTALVLALCLGICHGFQPLASYASGAGLPGRIRAGFRFTLLLSLGILIPTGLLLALFAEQAAAWFQPDPAALALCRTALRYAAFSHGIMPVSACANMLFQSTSCPIRSGLIAALRSGLIFLPLAWLLSRSPDPHALLLAQPLADLSASLLSIPIFLHYFRHLPQNSCN